MTTFKYSKINKKLPLHVLYSCVECRATLSVPVTGDWNFISRYAWLHGGWLFTMDRESGEGTGTAVTFQPLCAACQPKHLGPEVLAHVKEGLEERHGPPGVN